jgi:hypothetical protein
VLYFANPMVFLQARINKTFLEIDSVSIMLIARFRGVGCLPMSCFGYRLWIGSIGSIIERVIIIGVPKQIEIQLQIFPIKEFDSEFNSYLLLNLRGNSNIYNLRIVFSEDPDYLIRWLNFFAISLKIFRYIFRDADFFG